MQTLQSNIRNFTLMGHIDHGKSTLADAMLQLTGTIPNRLMRAQFLDKLTTERERGITIKLQTVRMVFNSSQSEQLFVLNLIDTPGHVDFSYEVSRSLAACEGVVLLIDASQGIQAQTLSCLVKAKKAGLIIIPVVNKIDLPNAQSAKIARQINQSLGFQKEEILYASGKTGEGVKNLLETIVRSVPAPLGNPGQLLRALVFDSFFDEHKGVVVLVKVVDGSIALPSRLFLLNTQTSFEPTEIGFITSKFIPSKKISAGEVGYIATGIKDIKKARVGATITQGSVKEIRAVKALPGYQEPQPMVFANIFPVDQSQYQSFRTSLEKLVLNDAALTLLPVSSPALGFGFQGGFLGQLHLEITRERLQAEFDQDVIITSPTVEYQDQKEPWVKVFIYTPDKFLGPIQGLCHQRRGIYVNSVYTSLLKLEYELPLSELVVDFHDQLKSVSSGFASLDYEFLEYREADLVKIRILINHQEIEELSIKCVRQKASMLGKNLVEKLKNLIPRQQFKIPIQAAINGKIIARADLSALRKDVTAKLYGGDRTRKDKLLQKQRKGKARLKKFGQVEIPSEVFLSLLKNF